MNLRQLQEQLNNLNEQLETRQNELYDEGNAYPQMDTEVVRLQGEITSVENTIQNAKNEVYAYAASRKRNELLKQRDDINSRIDARQSELYDNGNAYPQMDEQIINMQGELVTVNNRLAEVDQYINNSGYSSRLVSLQEQLNNLNDQLETRQNELYDEGNAYPQMDTEVIKLQGEITQITEEINKLNQTILENTAYVKLEELQEQYNKIEEEYNARLNELNEQEFSYTDQYSDGTLVNLDTQLKNIQSQMDNINNLISNNGLTNDIFNDIVLPVVVPVKEDTATNEPSEDISNESGQQQEETLSQDEPEKDDKNDLNALLDSLQNDLNLTAQRMKNAKEIGNDAAYVEERSRYSRIVEEIAKVQKQIEDEKISKEIEEKEKQLKECTDRMKNAKEIGNDAAYVEERSRYSRIVEEINNLKNKLNGYNQTPVTPAVPDKDEDKNRDNNLDIPSSDENNDNSSDNNEDEENTKEDEKEEENENNEEQDNTDNKEQNQEMTEEEEKETRKAKIKKAAWFALGGAVGFGLSFAVQPGTAGTIISVGRLAYAAGKKAIKSYTKKHENEPDNKIVKMIDKVNAAKASFVEKHPKIASAVAKVNQFLKKPSTQMFINGVATGYTVGKIAQAVHNMMPDTNQNKQNVIKDDGKTVEKTEATMGENVPDVGNEPTIDTDTPSIPDTTPDTSFDPTQPVDLSSIQDGYVSSYADSSVSLMTDAGKNAIFDKINVVDGKTMVHFKQSNGLGYAWFPAEDVMDALNISDISELTGEVSGGLTK